MDLEAAATLLARSMNEATLQENVRVLALVRGWKHYHTHDSRRSSEGFPDSTLVRGNRLIFAELKTERPKVPRKQKEWLTALKQAGAETYVWRPSNWLSGEIDLILK